MSTKISDWDIAKMETLEPIEIDVYGVIFTVYKSSLGIHKAIFVHSNTDMLSNISLNEISKKLEKYGFKFDILSTLNNKISMLFLK